MSEEELIKEIKSYIMDLNFELLKVYSNTGAIKCYKRCIDKIEELIKESEGKK